MTYTYKFNSIKMEKQIEEYIAQLDEQEKLVLEIAKDHLGSSFDIERSIGFTKWLAEQKSSNSSDK